MSFFLMPKTTFTLLSSFSLLKLHIKKEDRCLEVRNSSIFMNWLGLDSLDFTARPYSVRCTQADHLGTEKKIHIVSRF